MINIEIIGRLVRDPETRTTNSGVNVCTFTVAADHRYSSGGEKTSEFFRVNAWRGLGDTCAKFLTKGKQVYVCGDLKPRLFENKDGETKLSLDLEADKVEFLSPRGEGSSDGNSSAPTAKPATAQSDNESGDDLPF